MKCIEAQPLLIELLYGELPTQREVEIRGHLESCPACSEQFARLESAQRILANAVSVASDAQPGHRPVDVASIQRAVGAQVDHRRRFWKACAVLASLAAVLLAGVFLAGLTVEVHPTHLVVAWGAAASAPQERGADTSREARFEELQRQAAEHAERLVRLDELTHLVTSEVLSSERERSAEIAELRGSLVALRAQVAAEVGDLREQSDVRWRAVLNEFSRIAASTELAEAAISPLDSNGGTEQ
jgi:hypothetical protein